MWNRWNTNFYLDMKFIMKPREKLKKYGVKKLEGWELVALLLWSWIAWKSVFSLSKTVDALISSKKEDVCVEDLLSVRGIGPVKASQIVSGFELAKRYFVKDTVCIDCVDDVVAQVWDIRAKKQEHVICLILDGGQRLLSKEVITIWLLDQTLLHPREVFAEAIVQRAHSIVLVHNHPSGSLEPSGADRQMTKRIVDAGKLLGIGLRDHVIVTKDHFYSFLERGEL